MPGRIRVEQSPTLTVGTLVTQFNAVPTGTDSRWSRASDGNIVTPVIDGEILKIVLNYTSGYSTSVLALNTRDTPQESIVLVTGTNTDETIYPRVGAVPNTGVADTAATLWVPYAVHGSLLASCSGVTGETVSLKIYFR